jgi:hypothetical protein
MARKSKMQQWLDRHSETTACKHGPPIRYELQSKQTNGRKPTFVIETCFPKTQCDQKSFRTKSPSREKVEKGRGRKRPLILLCCPKTQKKGRCPVSQEMQHIAHPVSRFKKKHPAVWKELQKRGGVWKTGARSKVK